MYISDKVMNKTAISTRCKQATVVDTMAKQSLPVKTKLHTTQSLPIMRKYWKLDLANEDSPNSLNKGLISCLKNVHSLPNPGKLDHDNSKANAAINESLSNHQAEYQIETFGNNRTPSPITPLMETDTQTELIETFANIDMHELPNKNSFNFSFSDLPVSKLSEKKSPVLISEHNTETLKEPFIISETETNMATAVKQNFSNESQSNFPLSDVQTVNADPKDVAESFEDESTDNQEPGTPSAVTQRCNLKRQMTVFCQKGSTDSSSVKTDASFDEKTSTCPSSSTTSGNLRVFKSIYVNFNPEEITDAKHTVRVVIPKAKIDKATQVNHNEITKETGWDLIEGVYLLLRKISVNIPRQIDASAPNVHESAVSSSNVSPEKVSISNTALQIPLSPRDDTDYPPKSRFPDNDRSDPINPASIGPLVRQNMENCGNVNAWFEKNRQLNFANRLSPVRQYTIETVDSGFDDNHAPSNFNRQGRFSLPNVLSGNCYIYKYIHIATFLTVNMFSDMNNTLHLSTFGCFQ